MTAEIVLCRCCSQLYPEIKKIADPFGFPVKELSECADLTKIAVPDRTALKLLIMELDDFFTLSPAELSQINAAQNLSVTLLWSTKKRDAPFLAFQKCPQVFHILHSKPESIVAELEKILKVFSRVTAGECKTTVTQSVFIDLPQAKTAHLTKSTERWACYDEIGAFADGLECFPDFSNIVKTVASELITNAFYDAPRSEETGEALFPDRNLLVEVQPPQKIEFTYGISGSYLWVKVTDPYGTLNRKTLVKALHRAATEKTPRMDSPGGAGLGLIMLCDYASEIIFSIDEKKATTVACKLLITKRNRIFTEQAATFHIF
jgi:hypothetical protein